MGALGFGIGLNVRHRQPAEGLAALFAYAGPGIWYDPSDLGSMYQDSAGTVAAALDAPVGRINDKSGGGNHAVQPSAAARPILRESGGLPYLEFDGVDDYLQAGFAVAQPWDRISALRQITSVTSARIFDGVAANGALTQSGDGGLSVRDLSGTAAATAAVGASLVVTERHANETSRVAVNSGAYVSGATGLTAPGGITIGVARSLAGWASFRLYGVLMVGRELSNAEIAAARASLAATAGVTL